MMEPPHDSPIENPTRDYPGEEGPTYTGDKNLIKEIYCDEF